MFNHLRSTVIWFSSLVFLASAVLYLVTTTQAAAGGTLFSVAQLASARIVLSEDGSTLASAEAGGRISVLDLASGLERASLQGESDSVVTELAISRDGQALASVAAGVVTVWDLAAGWQREVSASDRQEIGVTDLVFSPDGQILAGVEAGNRIVVWDVATGAEQWIFPHGDGVVKDVAFSPDGSLLASSEEAAQITLWDLATGEEGLTLNNPSAAPVTGIAFNPIGTSLAAVDANGTITLWDSKQGDVQQTLEHQSQISTVAFSPDGTLLASGGTDPQITLWDLLGSREPRALPGYFDYIATGLTFSPDGSTLASVGEDNAVTLWDVSTGELRQTLVGQNARIAALAFSANQPTLASVGQDGRVIVWGLESGSERFVVQVSASASESTSTKPGLAATTTAVAPSHAAVVEGAASLEGAASPVLGTLDGGSSQAANAAAVSTGLPVKQKAVKGLALLPDGTQFASAHEDGAVELRDTDGQLLMTLTHPGNGASGVVFRGGSSKQLVSVGRDTVARVWDVDTGEQLRVQQGHEHPINAVAAGGNGNLLVSAGEETRIMVWDGKTGKLLQILSDPKRGHTDFVNTLAFSGNGKFLASGGRDARIVIWDVAKGEVLRTLRGHSGAVNALAFTKDNKFVISGSSDTTVRIWDAGQGRQIASMAGHKAAIRALAISTNGKTLASGGEDSRVITWSFPDGALDRVLSGHTNFINALLFLPTGDLLVGDEDGAIIQWELDKAQPKKVIKAEQPIQVSRAAEPNILIRLLEWLVPSAAAAPLADPNQGPGGPILVIDSAASTFGKYYAEILRTEGFNAFSVMDISAVTAATLSNYDVVVLSAMPLSASQVTMLSDWVTAGGNLIAMRPDPQLSGLLGLTATGSTLSEGYLRVDTSQQFGNGIVDQTIQFHGTAERYTLNGASQIATLYTDAATATSNPAVSLHSVGANGGQAAVFAYDLATSIVYTRQGNPAWAEQERDGFPPIRSDDKYYGAAVGDPQLDWVDLNKVAIPQADEQQRLLANLIIQMNLDRMPLPRFWYFPRGEKAVVIMTGDDHANNGTAGRFDQFIASSPPGCNVEDWECVRGTSYIYPNTPLSDAQAAAYAAQGFEVGLHVNTNCADYTPAQLEAFYNQQIPDFTSNFPSVPPLATQRHHCIAWSDWVTGAKVQLARGIRLDTSYYFWPPGWVGNVPGLFTGSGMPMRFADLDGTLIDVYQAASQMTDESGQQYPFTIDTLLDRALGPEGYYGAYTINAHTDVAQIPEADAVVASALARGVPIVSSQQMLDWLDGRDSSSFGSLSWNGTALSFTVTPGTGANGLQALLPMFTGAGVLTSVTHDGGSVLFSTDVVKGITYGRFAAPAGAYEATYAVDTAAPTVTSTTPATGATDIGLEANVTAGFSEAMDPVTVTSATFELRDAADALVAATVTYDAASRTATLNPSTALTPSTTYTATLKGGAAPARVEDVSGNPLSNDVSWSFTTGAGYACPCSVWDSAAVPASPSVADPNAVELGVKFSSDVDGFVTGIRFYKGTANTGTHIGNLWSIDGTQLATATFSGESASGWQQVDFSTPVPITANTVYVASYFAPVGNYAGDSGYFAATGVANGPLQLLQDGVSGGNGVYGYSASSTFPSQTWQATNYWVDVVFTEAGGSDTTAPTVTGTIPADGLSDVAVSSAVSASFSEQIDAATVNGSTFELRDAGNTLMSAIVSYDAASRTATLTPSAPLDLSTTYTARLKGGVTDPRIKDLAGNALAADVTWSFTTAAELGGCDAPANPIVAENCQLGNAPSEWDVVGSGDGSIQGFATDISVNRGETVSFKIDTDASDYRLDIYRMGYYGGLGARKVATVQPSAALPQSQPACLNDPATGLIDCGNWAESASWAVPAGATSGIYFAKLVRTDTGGASHIVFIVRDDASTSDLLFQTADTTWQAYNEYGGNSLYTGAPAGRAYKVSYNRPFNTRSVDGGQDWVFNAEYPMVRWLEANGYDVSYFTGVDSDRRGSLITNHRVFLSVGHDEYWSAAQRANVEAARDAGVHLAFFSGNEVFWKTRWENSIDGSGTPYRSLVCYKETLDNAVIDPAAPIWTGTWRDPRFSPPGDGGRPENALTGTIFTVNAGATTSIQVPAEDGRMRFWRNTSVATLAPGTSATLADSTLGYEWDEDLDNGFRPPGLVRLSTTVVDNAPVLLDYGSTYGSGTATHHLTLYKHSSGALVFGAGTVQWSWGLDGNHDLGSAPPDGRMQQATVNLFADMAVQPATLEAGLTPASASSDTSAPTSTITSPIAGSNLEPGVPLTISGTGTDAGGGLVGGIEVSVDGGASWHPANGRANWSYPWTPTVPGSVTILSRAVDDSGNLEAVGSGITVSVGNTAPVASAVVISGAAEVGQALTGTYTYTDADGDSEGVSTYRWLRDGVAIAGATATSYALVAADQGANIEFEVTPVATAGVLTGSPVTSAPVGPVAPAGAANTPPVASAVVITGAAEVGQALTGTYTYTDADGDSEGVTTYRWLRDGAAIAGATATSYTLVVADQGANIEFEVTPVATTGVLTGSPVTSAPVGPVAPAGAANTAPVASAVAITGAAEVGQALTGTYTYTDADGDSEGDSTYRWLRDGVAIAGATATSYTLVAADQGTNIVFEVTPVATTGVLTGSPVASSPVLVINTQPNPPGLVAAYNFDEGGGLTVADASGNGNTGTISGATWTTAGKVGNALVFNGADSLVNVADANTLDLTSGMTLEAWLNPTALSGWRTVILKERSNGLAYALYAHDNAPPRPAGYIRLNRDIPVRGNGALPLNTWTHLAVTYDGALLRLYENGIEVDSRAVSGDIATSAGALRIGGNVVWGEYFSGSIDEVRIYNRALTATEILTDMGGGG